MIGSPSPSANAREAKWCRSSPTRRLGTSDFPAAHVETSKTRHAILLAVQFCGSFVSSRRPLRSLLIAGCRKLVVSQLSNPWSSSRPAGPLEVPMVAIHVRLPMVQDSQ